MLPVDKAPTAPAAVALSIFKALAAAPTCPSPIAIFELPGMKLKLVRAPKASAVPIGPVIPPRIAAIVFSWF